MENDLLNILQKQSNWDKPKKLQLIVSKSEYERVKSALHGLGNKFADNMGWDPAGVDVYFTPKFEDNAKIINVLDKLKDE